MVILYRCGFDWVSILQSRIRTQQMKLTGNSNLSLFNQSSACAAAVSVSVENEITGICKELE